MIDNSKLNILLCSPHGGTIGGISRWTGHVLRHYDSDRNNNLNLLLHNTKREKSVYARDSNLKRIISGFFEYYKQINVYKKRIVKDDVDIVHITSSASFGLLRDLFMLYYARKRNIKSVIHFRFGRIPELYKTKGWERKMLDKVIRKSDRVIVIDKQSHLTLVEKGFKHISLLPNPLAPSVNKIIKENKSIIKKDRSVVFVGHVQKTKGVFELVRVCKEIPNITLSLIGAISDDIKEKLTTLAGENNHSWLFLKGEYNSEGVIKEMLSASVFVLPTYTEGFPNVILEAMACGCSIVSTSVGAIPEMLNVADSKSYGICIMPKNDEELKEAIIKMLNNKQFALECGVNAKKRVNLEYSMSKVWTELNNIWKLLKEE